MTQIGAGMHPEDVKAALRKGGVSLAAIARQAGLHRSGPAAVLRNPRYSKPTELLIAEALGVSPASIWPDRWAADGSPLPRCSLGTSDAVTGPQSSQKKKAA